MKSRRRTRRSHQDHVLATGGIFRHSIGMLLALVLMSFAGCAPVFSELQSARLVGKGHTEVTPSISSVSFSNDGDSEHIQNHFGVQGAYGVGEKVDLRLRYERIQVDTGGRDSFGVNVLAFGAKIATVKDRSAFYIPVGFAFGSEIDDVSETIAFHPTILFSIPASQNLELNPSAKALIPTNDSDVLLAFNVGAGISNDLTRWALRPEIGFLLNPGEDGHFMHLSIGVTVYQ